MGGQVRRRLIGFAASLLLGFSLAIAPVSASASPAGAETISTAFAEDVVTGLVSGSFSATGTFTDSGSLSSDQFRIKDALGHTALTTAERTWDFSGQSGSFTIATQDVVTFSGACAAIDGTWVVVSGTGAYASLHGAGKLSGTVCVVAFPSAAGNWTYRGAVNLGSGS
jgi:hypothetical protein